MIARCSAFGLVARALVLFLSVEPPDIDGATGSPSSAASALLSANSLGVVPDTKVLLLGVSAPLTLLFADEAVAC